MLLPSAVAAAAATAPMCWTELLSAGCWPLHFCWSCKLMRCWHVRGTLAQKHEEPWRASHALHLSLIHSCTARESGQNWPKPRPLNRECSCHGLPYSRHALAVVCHVFAMCLPCSCHALAMLLPCSCHVLQCFCFCHVFAMLSPCFCHVFAMCLLDKGSPAMTQRLR